MLHLKTLSEMADDLAEKRYSATELVTHFLNRIQNHDSELNAFITVTKEQALSTAKKADQDRMAGTAHKLAGIPIAQKDIFCTKGIKTTCGSFMLDNFIAPYDATLIERCNQAGLATLGKTNMDEFAMGSSNENSYYGPVRNPWDVTRVPGGSSGGSAAAVAARLAPIATGTDTGGSIRQPAALCNLTGLKPTYGRISRYGMIAYASSLDQGGLFGLSAEDLALVLQITAGFDEKDSTSVDHAVPDYSKTLHDSLQGVRIGIPKEYFTAGLNPQIAHCIHEAIKVYEKLGATIKDISLPHSDLSIPAYYVIAPAECSSNLSRYDGIRYGHRCENPVDLSDLYRRSRAEGFGSEVKRRIMIGTYALSAGYYDAYYLKAQQIRQLIRQDFVEAFKEVDFILGPTTPDTAFKLGEKTNDPISMYLSDIYTISVNLAGLPAISAPAGFSDNLPVGMQLIGSDFSEAKLLNIIHQFQQHTDWHKRMPEGV
ncbi:MAG: Asp-tRNA(Asn)/Glu-tRNA(Gln) amidotransferase subunit GatA [Legionellales bacterium]|nr:Asp-tRNA(Asn)/Glu-tRNA(Gln) amidotransferase subunit GatA [Legionellales bacterium]